MPRFDELAILNAPDGNSGEVHRRARGRKKSIGGPVNADEIGLGQGDDRLDGEFGELRTNDVVEMHEPCGPAIFAGAAVIDTGFGK